MPAANLPWVAHPSALQSSALVEWQAPAGADGFAFLEFLLERDDGDGFTAFFHGVESSCHVDGLDRESNAPPLLRTACLPVNEASALGAAARPCRLRVCAACEEGFGPWSEELVVDALTAGRVPEPPRGLTFQPGRSGPPQLTWEPSEGATSYDVAVRLLPAGDWKPLAVDIDDTSAALGALEGGASYEARVRASAGGAPSEWCEPVPFRTAVSVPEAPQVLLDQLGTCGCTLTIAPPESNGGAPVLGYRVERRSVPPEGGSMDDMASSSSAGPAAIAGDWAAIWSGSEDQIGAIAIHDLRPGWTYHFRAIAVNGVGSSEPGDAITISTEAERPGVPIGPRLLAPPSATSARIIWGVPESRGAPVSFYEAEIAAAAAAASSLVWKVSFSPACSPPFQLPPVPKRSWRSLPRSLPTTARTQRVRSGTCSPAAITCSGSVPQMWSASASGAALPFPLAPPRRHLLRPGSCTARPARPPRCPWPGRLPSRTMGGP